MATALKPLNLKSKQPKLRAPFPYFGGKSAVAKESREPRIFGKDSFNLAPEVARWAIDQGNDPKLRIALCGYEGEHVMPADWSVFAWKAQGGFGNTSRKGKATANLNRGRERIWFSPHCLDPGA